MTDLRERAGKVTGRFGYVKARLVSALAALTSMSLLASPVQHSKRLINVYQVDLSPLFKWWTKHEGPRPLAAWVHITGAIVATNAVGWIVEANVEGAEKMEGNAGPGSGYDPLKIILRTPPLEDLTDFQGLSSKLATLNAQRATLATEEAQDKEREQVVAAQQHGARGSRGRILSFEDRQLKQAENQAKAGQKPLDQQIQEIKAKLAVYGSTDRYTVDSFALDLQSDYEKMPVYDHGRIMK